MGKKTKKFLPIFYIILYFFWNILFFQNSEWKNLLRSFFSFRRFLLNCETHRKKDFRKIFSCNRVKTKFSEFFVFKWNSVTIIFVLRSKVKKNFRIFSYSRMFSQMKIKIRRIYRCNTASGHWARSEANLNCLSKYYWTE